MVVLFDWRLRVKGGENDITTFRRAFVFRCVAGICFVVLVFLLLNNIVFCGKKYGEECIALFILLGFLAIWLMALKYDYYLIMDHKRIEERYLEVNGSSNDIILTRNAIKDIEWKIEEKANDNRIVKELLLKVITIFIPIADIGVKLNSKIYLLFAIILLFVLLIYLEMKRIAEMQHIIEEKVFKDFDERQKF